MIDRFVNEDVLQNDGIVYINMFKININDLVFSYVLWVYTRKCFIWMFATLYLFYSMDGQFKI